MKVTYLKILSAMAVLIIALAEAVAIFAASKDGEFALKGVGYNSCGDFSASRAKRTNQYYRFIGWIEGYLSAYNRFMPDTINIAPWQDTEFLAYFLNAYCQKHPKIPYVVAIDNMIAELTPNRLKKSSDILEVTNEKFKVTIY